MIGKVYNHKQLQCQKGKISLYLMFLEKKLSDSKFQGVRAGPLK